VSVFRRGKTWWYEFVFNGRRIRESTRSSSETLAIKAERNRRREFEESANGILARRDPILFTKAAREWMAANKARWSSSNIAIQEYNLKHLKELFGNLLLTDITAPLIGKYQLKRKQDAASNRTINMEIGTLRMVLKTFRLWPNLAPDVKMLPETKEIGKALTPDEEMRLLDACRNSPSRSLYPAVVIFCNTGLRSSELRSARWNQVDFLKGEFQVGKSKTAGSEGRVIPLNRNALQAIKEWRACWPNAKPGHFIFPTEKLVFKGNGAVERQVMSSYQVDPTKPLGSWKRAWNSAKKAANVKCRLHDLRHHFISALAQTQTPDATIQAISGHLSRKMLDHYSHVARDAKRKAVESLNSNAPQVKH